VRLDRRLRLLRGQAAPLPAEDTEEAEDSAPAPSLQPPDEGPALSERLRRVSVSTKRTPTRKERDEPAFAAALCAETLAPGVLRVEHRLPLSRRQGRFELGACVAALPMLMKEPPGAPDSWLFLDTETSGLAGGTGTWAFLAGLARIDGAELLLRQYLLTRLDAEPEYLAAFRAELDRAELFVTYNGKSFDAPLLTTRLRLAGIRGGLEDKRHLDLLHPTRRAFARVWPNCRLATVEQRLLGMRRKDDLPGAEAPQAWLAWLRHGETRTLTGVLAHNRQDLLTLPALTSALALSLDAPAAVGADVCAVARHWLGRGDADRAFSILSDGRDRLDDAGFLELARLHRRRGEWGEAESIWRTLTAQGHPLATEALAKYMEHQRRDYAEALALTERLPARQDRERRRRRLESKLQARSRAHQFSRLGEQVFFGRED